MTGSHSAPEVAGGAKPRNRYVDLLRVASILVVVVGHWLGTVAWVDGASLRLDYLGELRPWSVWLTLLFQVMPVFFFVGGYAHAASWDAARRDGTTYSTWVGLRVSRFYRPVLPLLVVWAVLVWVAGAMGSSVWTIHAATRLSFGPLWFLVVYPLITLTVPWSLSASRRFGLGYPVLLLAGVAAVDLGRFGFGVEALGWLNYLFVFSALHALGFLWRDGRAARPAVLAAGVLGGAGLLAVLFASGYSNDLVVPSKTGFSNVMPPSLAFLALGIAQAGLLLAIRRPANRWLKGDAVWRLTQRLSPALMTIYLWHTTAMLGVIWCAWQFGGPGMHVQGGSAGRLALLPAWMAVYAMALAVLVWIFIRFERVPAGLRPRPLWWSLAATAAICVGLSAMNEIGADKAWPGVRWGFLALAIAGAAAVYFARSE